MEMGIPIGGDEEDGIGWGWVEIQKLGSGSL